MKVKDHTIRTAIILGVKVSVISLPDLLAFIMAVISSSEKALLAYVNVHAINIAYELSWFRLFLNRAQIVFCDGFGVKFAGSFLSRVSLYRYTPPDWLDQLVVLCCENGYSMFFLGAQPGVAEAAAEKLYRKYPDLPKIVTMHGYFDKTLHHEENELVIERINHVKPNILLVGFGMPAQEKWLLENLDRLSVNIIVPVGAMFDYIAGTTPRAPRWMTDHGLEWLGRLVIEPGRLWKRYIIGNPLFLWRVLLQKFGLLKFEDK